MKIDILSKNIELNKALRDYIDEKIGSLSKLFPEPVLAKVEVGRPSKKQRSGPVFYAEGNIKLGKTLFRAESTHEDLHTAINEVRDDLQAQISKQKKKFVTKKKKSSIKGK